MQTLSRSPDFNQLQTRYYFSLLLHFLLVCPLGAPYITTIMKCSGTRKKWFNFWNDPAQHLDPGRFIIIQEKDNSILCPLDVAVYQEDEVLRYYMGCCVSGGLLHSFLHLFGLFNRDRHLHLRRHLLQTHFLRDIHKVEP